MRNILNNILSILGYKIKRSKWLYENDKNLIATLKSQNINSIIDVGASSGQFAEQVFKNGFKWLIYSFEPLKKEHDILLIKSKKKEGGNWKIQKRCALGATNKDVEIKVVIDPSVIGGLVTEIGDDIIDGSVRRRLNQLRENFR